MNWLVVAAVVAVAVLVYALWAELEGLGIVSIFVLVLGGMFFFVAGVNQYDFAPAMARMQQTRDAVERLPCASSFSASKIYGDAVAWNQEIVSNRIWNQRWVADPFIHDGWDTVSVIVVPTCTTEAP